MPRAIQIKRSLLIECIEEGISHAPTLRNEQRAALREVGLTAERVAYGNYDSGQGVVCPACAAGLADRDGDPYPGVDEDAIPDFAYNYDDAVHRRLLLPLSIERTAGVMVLNVVED